MAKSKQISLVVITCAHMGSAQKPCKQPANANCIEPYLLSDDAKNQDDPWELWKLEHHKTYNSAEEEAHRHGVWMNITNWMIGKNGEFSTFSLGWNSLSDLTHEEFAEFRGLNNPRTDPMARLGSLHHGTHYHHGKLTDLPSDWDWSLADPPVVTWVKDQQCSDCWAFSAAAALEGALAVATGWIDSLSPQQFVDCSGAGSCHGGEEGDAMNWATNNFACSWDSYPETGYDGNCDWNCYQVITAGSIWGTYGIGQDEGSLCSGLIQRPLTVGVGADPTFHAYSGGILKYQTTKHENHAILAVGYGYWNGDAYWKVKNSWGTSWGLDGYALLFRGGGTDQNYIMSDVVGVYVFGPYNPSMSLTDLNGLRISAPTAAPVVA